MQNKWLEICNSIMEDSSQVTTLICPICKHSMIDYLFIGDLKSRIGYCHIWCNHCVHGFQMSRVCIPRNAKSVDFNDTIVDLVPNYTVVNIYK